MAKKVKSEKVGRHEFGGGQAKFVLLKICLMIFFNKSCRKKKNITAG